MACCFPNCPNRFYPPKRNISYFRLPNPSKHPQVHQAWVLALNSPIFKPSQRPAVCELHFTEADYDESYKLKKKLMPHEYFKPLLKTTAVPKPQLLEEVEEKQVNEEEEEEVLRRLLGDRVNTMGVVRREEEKVAVVRKKHLEIQGNTNFIKKLLPVEEKKVAVIRKKQAKTNQNHMETQTQTNDNLIFKTTTDYILNKPLRPLPDALQRLLPSILGVVITNVNSVPTPTFQQLRLFSCCEPLKTTDLYSCHRCKYTSSLKLHLIHHTNTAHRPIRARFRAVRQPMKIWKPQPIPKYQCWHCDFTTFSKLVFFRHIYMVSDIQLLKKIKCFRCIYCTFKSVSSCSVKLHIRKEHRKNKRTLGFPN